MPHLDWSWEDKPVELGWYAITYCWEVEEGSFLGKARWTGEQWQSTLPISSFAGPFTSEEEAEKWGEEHDATF